MTPDVRRRQFLPAGRARRLVPGLLGGALAARLGSVVLPVTVGEFAVYASALGFLLLFWAVPRLVIRQPPAADPALAALGVGSGIALDELVFLVVRQAGRGYWSGPSVLGAVGLVGVAAVGVLALDRWMPDRGPYRVTPAVPGLAALAVLGSIAAYRVSQAYLLARGVPNEARSLVVLGYEIHHATTGTLLLVLGGLLAAYRGPSRRAWVLAGLAAAAGCGFVADEYVYFFYRPVTDARYFTTLSLVGGVVTGVAVAAAYVYNYYSGRPIDP